MNNPTEAEDVNKKKGVVNRNRSIQASIAAILIVFLVGKFVVLGIAWYVLSVILLQRFFYLIDIAEWVRKRNPKVW